MSQAWSLHKDMILMSANPEVDYSVIYHVKILRIASLGLLFYGAG